MKTYTITGYQPYGTSNPSAYIVQVSYRGEPVAEFTGERACEHALRYVSKNGGRAVVNMGDRA